MTPARLREQATDEVSHRRLGEVSHESLRLGVPEEGYATIDMQLFVALMQMNLDSALANCQFVSNFLVAQTTSREANDFELT